MVTEGADPAAAFVGVGGSAAVAFVTRTHTEVPAVRVGHALSGSKFHRVKSEAETSYLRGVSHNSQVREEG